MTVNNITAGVMANIFLMRRANPKNTAMNLGYFGYSAPDLIVLSVHLLHKIS